MDDARDSTFEDLSSGGFGYRVASSDSDDGAAAFAAAKQRAVSRFERSYLEALMKRAGGNISRAAREAELARHHLRELLRKHGLYVPPDSEAPPPGNAPPSKTPSSRPMSTSQAALGAFEDELDVPFGR